MKTYNQVKTYTKKKEEIEPQWWQIDAEGQTLGRLASRVATILRGKHHPDFAPHLDMGDYVVVVNVDGVEVTGNKAQQKLYRWHTRYPGGDRSLTFEELLEKHPERVLRLAVRGMLPRNRLGRKLLRKLKIYAGPDHPHQAQQPLVLDLGDDEPAAAIAAARAEAAEEATA